MHDALNVRDISLLASAVFISVQVFGLETTLGATRSGVRIPAGARDLPRLQNIYTCSGPPRSLLFKVYLGYLPGKSGRCVKFITQIDLALKFRMSGAVPLLPYTASWCDKENFTFTSKCEN